MMGAAQLFQAVDILPSLCHVVNYFYRVVPSGICTHRSFYILYILDILFMVLGGKY